MNTHQTTPLKQARCTAEVKEFLAEHGLDPNDVRVHDARIEDGVLIVTRFRRNEEGQLYIDPEQPNQAATYPEERMPAKRVFVGPRVTP